MAPGLLTSADEASEVILFTPDTRTLHEIAKHDEATEYYSDDTTSIWINKLIGGVFERPSTAENPNKAHTLPLPKPVNAAKTIARHRRVSAAFLPSVVSTADLHSAAPPSTSALVTSTLPVSAVGDQDASDEADFLVELRATTTLPPESPQVTNVPDDRGPMSVMRSSPERVPTAAVPPADLFFCCAVALVIESTWGDPDFVGLCGIELLAKTNSTALRLDPTMITAVPRDLLAFGFDDQRSVDKLVDGVNDTTDENHMWLIPFTKGSNHYVRFEFKQNVVNLAGLRVWNYNKNGETVVRGAKVVTIIVYDKAGKGRRLGRCILRQGPGCDGVSFGQRIFFRDVLLNNNKAGMPTVSIKYISPPLKQVWEVPYLPRGQLLKLTLYDNFSDAYYIGLDAIEIFDDQNKIIAVRDVASVTAVPHSLQDLASTNDPRTPERLFSRRDAVPGEVPWLAPIARCMTKQERDAAGMRVQGGGCKTRKEFSFFPENVLFCLFDAPTTISLIRIYNYSKNCGRGVKTLAIHLDGLLCYMGNLLPASSECTVEGPKGLERHGQSIVMSTDPKVVRQEMDRIPSVAGIEQDVLCIDERQVKIRSKQMYSADPSPFAERENTAVVINAQRPSTSLGNVSKH